MRADRPVGINPSKALLLLTHGKNNGSDTSICEADCDDKELCRILKERRAVLESVGKGIT